MRCTSILSNLIWVTTRLVCTCIDCLLLSFLVKLLTGFKEKFLLLEVVLSLCETVVFVASLAATPTRAAWLEAAVHALVQTIQNCSSQLLRILELFSNVFFLLSRCSS